MVLQELLQTHRATCSLRILITIAYDASTRPVESRLLPEMVRPRRPGTEDRRPGPPLTGPSIWHSIAMATYTFLNIMDNECVVWRVMESFRQLWVSEQQ